MKQLHHPSGTVSSSLINWYTLPYTLVYKNQSYYIGYEGLMEMVLAYVDQKKAQNYAFGPQIACTTACFCGARAVTNTPLPIKHSPIVGVHHWWL